MTRIGAPGLVFGIYPGGNLGTEDAEFTGPATSGPDDDAAHVETLLSQLHGSGPDERSFLVRGYIPYTDEGVRAHPEQPANLAQYARGYRKLDLVLTYHSDSGDVEGFTAFVRAQIRRHGDLLAVVQVTEEANLDLVPGTTDGSYPRVHEAIVAGVKAAKDELVQAGLGHIEVGFNCVPRERMGDDEPFHAKDDAFWAELGSHVDDAFLDALDFVGIDLYPDVFLPAAPAGENGDIRDRIVENLRTLREASMLTAGIPGSVAIHVTESGWPTGGERTLEAQSAAIEAGVRAVHDHRGAFNVTCYEFFDLRDADDRPDSIWHGFGVVRANYVPKPAFATLQALIQELGRPVG